MAGGGGGGGDVVPVSRAQAQPRGRGGRRRQQSAAWLPLDIVAEIAARSDPATLVRCAATCRDARRHIAEDPSLRGRLRLRLRETDRFVLPLLRGHLTGIRNYTCGSTEKTDIYLVDTTTAADATRLVKVTFASGAEAETPRGLFPVDSRGGLVLVRATTTSATIPWQTKLLGLLVCNPATRRRLALPPDPKFPNVGRSSGVRCVLLVGDSDGEGGDAVVGRPFHVLKAKLVLSEHIRSQRRLLVQTFSSRHGAWSPVTEIPTPNVHGSDSWRPALYRKPLVIGDVVHWLCLTDRGSYMLMLHATAARVNESALPASFPRDGNRGVVGHRYLLATATAGGNPVVLVADTEKISAWEQSKHTKMWRPRPQVVIENEAVLRADDKVAEVVERDRRIGRKHVPELVWFGERSGAVLLRFGGGLLWLDLHSKKIVRSFSSDHRMSYAKVYCPYEVDLPSWVPTFSSAGNF